MEIKPNSTRYVFVHSYRTLWNVSLSGYHSRLCLSSSHNGILYRCNSGDRKWSWMLQINYTRGSFSHLWTIVMVLIVNVQKGGVKLRWFAANVRMFMWNSALRMQWCIVPFISHSCFHELSDQWAESPLGLIYSVQPTGCRVLYRLGSFWNESKHQRVTQSL